MRLKSRVLAVQEKGESESQYEMESERRRRKCDLIKSTLGKERRIFANEQSCPTSRLSSSRRIDNVWEQTASYRAMTRIPTRNQVSSKQSSTAQSATAPKIGEINDYSQRVFEPNRTAHVSFKLNL